MKKAIAALVGVFVLVNAGAVAYKMGWLARFGIGSQAAPTTSPPAPATGAPEQSAQPGTVPPAAGAPETTTTAQGGQTASGSSGAQAGHQAPFPAPKFDGNVASIDFGAQVERTTANYGDTADHSYIIDGNPETAWRNGGSSQSVGEIVFSFFAREVVLVDAVVVQGSKDDTDHFPRDVEVLVSTAATPDGPFAKVASSALASGAEGTVTFGPVEARFVKFRMLKNQKGDDAFYVTELKIREAQRAGYTPLLTRHPELAQAGGPVAPPGGLPVPASTVPPCEPLSEAAAAAAAKPAHAESSRILVVGDDPLSYMANRLVAYIKDERLNDGLAESDLGVVKRAKLSTVIPESARPALLAPALGVDTVVLAQVCDIKTSVSPAFKQALMAWVAAGHKLIIQDSDDCVNPGPDYSFLPFTFKADLPGAMGAQGMDLRFIESNAMLTGRPGRPGFLDVAGWSGDVRPFRNELGDANALREWDSNWCGQLAVRNVNGVFGFSMVYGHYGRGLIIYEGFDNDQGGEPGYDTVLVRELSQPFDPDGLPCAARLGEFVVTTDARLMDRPAVPGRTYSYPLTLLSNAGYKGTVSLSAASSPGLPGLQTRFEPPSVTLAGEGASALALTLPAGAKPAPLAVEVKGTDASGKVNTLCLQLGPARSGELTIASALPPPTKMRRNLEIILDASGSMKTLMGKKSRWDVALDTLQNVLAKLPDDFNVGLRIYGHREPSTSPRTCTDSELVVPIEKLNRQNVLNRAKAFRPKGETPLVYSALQAPGDLKNVGGGTVILITDGEESCKGDTVKAAADLKASGLDIRLNIVGFALSNAKTQQDLAGFSQATGGLFYAAQSGEALGDALMVAAVEKFPYTVYDAAGKVVLSGEVDGGTDQLPPGEYKVVVKAGTREIVVPRVTIAAGQAGALTLAMKKGQLVIGQ
jgi:hypothetical protein